MDPIEQKLLQKYAEAEQREGYYDKVQKVTPNYTVYPKHNEKVNRMIITENGPERIRKMGRVERFFESKRKDFPHA
jgi:hypothetical protein